MAFEQMTRTQITKALQRLGELAQFEGTRLEVSLYGGAVFTLVYGSRASTRDVDAIIHPSALAKRLAARVASEQGLAEAWLSDDVRFFLADTEAKRELKGDDFGPGLNISVPTAAYLLAMKMRACRAPLPGNPGDYADIEYLLNKMEISSFAEAEAIFARFFPHDVLPDAARPLIEKTVVGKTR
jgi:hypothetical protein